MLPRLVEFEEKLIAKWLVHDFWDSDPRFEYSTSHSDPEVGSPHCLILYNNIGIAELSLQNNGNTTRPILIT